MARMIPPFFDDNIKSNGEKKLFHVLEAMGGNHVVLHSLGLARHESKVFGEIDFVVISDQGVLCLEIKGGHVSREGGRWYFSDRYGKENSKNEGPFEQAQSGTASLRKCIQQHFGTSDPIAKCQFAWGVVFTDMPFTQKGPDILPEVIFDSRNSSDEFSGYVQGLFAYWRNELMTKHGFIGGELTAANMSRLEKFLRGDFGFVPSLSYIIDQTAEKLLTLTHEQINRLAMARTNPRILLKGGAGTGKTIISVEHARRMAATGKSTLYLCFNQALCLHLQDVIPDGEGRGYLKITTFHGLLAEFLDKIGYLPEKACGEDSYYTEALPDAFLQCLSSGIEVKQYDMLVVDEGQDLLTLNYIGCLDRLVVGGLSKGNWHICYDPNQNLYNPELSTGIDLMMEYKPTTLELDTNCRNTRPIGVHTTIMSGMTPTRFFRMNGDNVVREKYSDFADERRKVVVLVKRLLGQGLNPGSICLLSRYKYENSCLEGKNILEGICRFQNITHTAPHLQMEGGIRFSTIHSFKGLEAKVVILLDVEGFLSTSDRQLNYTGMSRAISLLYIFYNENLEGELDSLIDESAILLERIEG